MSEPAPQHLDYLLTCVEVQEITGLSKSTLYTLVRAGKFPKARRLSSNRVAWRGSDVQAWIDRAEVAG